MNNVIGDYYNNNRDYYYYILSTDGGMNWEVVRSNNSGDYIYHISCNDDIFIRAIANRTTKIIRVESSDNGKDWAGIDIEQNNLLYCESTAIDILQCKDGHYIINTNGYYYQDYDDGEYYWIGDHNPLKIAHIHI